MKASLAIRFSLLAVMALIGCSVGPKYERPEVEGKKTWDETRAAQLAPSQIMEMDWWKGFADPYLDKLVKEAVSGSFDLKILLGRIQEAGATIKGARAQLMPTLDLSTKAEFSRAEVPQLGGEVADTQTATGQSSLSWEIDMWGKKRR
jgi:outer membrane protein TolC